jgi:hypothetical protein
MNCFHNSQDEGATLILNGFDDKIVFHWDGTACKIVKIYNKNSNNSKLWNDHGDLW